ncbi:MAG: hypothetical protein OEZ34_10605 [Spirochaetia bacterium]|nr:hypothetical protein [Spirochaetia bacterium]
MKIRIRKFQTAVFFLILLAACVFSGCAKTGHANYQSVSPSFSEEKKTDEQQIIQILENLHSRIIQNDLTVLLEHVHKQKGLFVDLKAHKSYREIEQEIADPESYLNTFFLDPEKLKTSTGDPEQKTIKDILSSQKNIDLEFHFNKTNDECEVKIILKKKKKENFRLNNPYFIKIDGKWYLYRLL